MWMRCLGCHRHISLHLHLLALQKLSCFSVELEQPPASALTRSQAAALQLLKKEAHNLTKYNFLKQRRSKNSKEHQRQTYKKHQDTESLN